MGEKKGPEEISIPVWAGHGTGRLVRRDCLPWNHKWSTYSYIKNELKLEPEKYGVKGPSILKCPYCDQPVREDQAFEYDGLPTYNQKVR